MDEREQFIKTFVQTGKSKGASKEEVATKLQSALTEYDQMVASRQPPSALENVASFVAPQTTKTVKRMASGEIAPAIDDLIGINGMSKFRQQTGGAEREIGAYAVPSGAGFVNKAITGLTSGALIGSAKDDPTASDVALGGVVGMVANPIIGKASNLVAKGVGGTIKAVGNEVAERGENLIASALRPNNSQQTGFKQKTGQYIRDFMRKEGLTGDFVSKVDEMIKETQKKFDEIAVNSGVKIDKDTIVKNLNKSVGDLIDSTDDDDAVRLAKVQKIFENIYKKYGEEKIDVGDLTKERRFYDAKNKKFSQSPETASVYQLVRDALTDAIHEGTEKAGHKGLRELGLRQRDLFEFQKIAIKQEPLGKGNNPVGLISTLMTGVGGTVGGLPGAVAGYGASKVMQDPRAIAGASKLGENAGKQLYIAGQKTENALKLEAMQRMLRNTSTSNATN